MSSTFQHAQRHLPDRLFLRYVKSMKYHNGGWSPSRGYNTTILSYQLTQCLCSIFKPVLPNKFRPHKPLAPNRYSNVFHSSSLHVGLLLARSVGHFGVLRSVSSFKGGINKRRRRGGFIFSTNRCR